MDSGNSGENKRSLPRHQGHVLCLDVSDAQMPLIDMTTKGIGFIGEGFAVGDMVNLWLVAADDPKDCVETLCEVVNVRDDRVAAVFNRRTERLETFIITHIVDDPPLIHE